MATRITLKHEESVRKRIQASQIINRLQSHINGELPLENSQVKAAQILLAKSVPDLSTVTLKGDEENPIRVQTESDEAVIARYLAKKEK